MMQPNEVFFIIKEDKQENYYRITSKINYTLVGVEKDAVSI